MRLDRINPSVIIFLLLLYFGMCAGIWHWAYWSTFDINYLQYIDAADIIKDFAMPFISSCGLSVFYLIGARLWTFLLTRQNPEENDKCLRITHKIVGLIPDIFILIFVVGFIISNMGSLRVIPFCLSLSLSYMLIDDSVIKRSIPVQDIRKSVLVFLCFLPSFSIMYGWLEADKITKNHEYKSISHIVINNDIDTSLKNTLNGLKYLGSSDHKMFFATFDNSRTVILNNDDVVFIELASYKYSTP